MKRIGIFFLAFLIALPLYGGQYKIFLDAGHGGKDPGALGINGSASPDEKDFNLDIALLCYDDLTFVYGYSVKMTRTTDPKSADKSF